MTTKTKRAPSKAAVLRKARALGRGHAVVQPRWEAVECADGSWLATISLPNLRTVNELNGGLTWREVRGDGGVAAPQRVAVKAGMRAWLSSPLGGPSAAPPYEVRLLRSAPSKGLDDDGLRAALKRVRDTVASSLGVGDSASDPITWDYQQGRGRWGVVVEV